MLDRIDKAAQILADDVKSGVAFEIVRRYQYLLCIHRKIADQIFAFFDKSLLNFLLSVLQVKISYVFDNDLLIYFNTHLAHFL